MRICQISTPTFRTPPRGYGGVERVASWLTEALLARGHDVTLLATPDSITAAKLLPFPVKNYLPCKRLDAGMVYR